MNTQYSDKAKKRIIALLLFVSCIITGLLLIYSSPASLQQLHSFAQADTLIMNNITKFNIGDDQIRLSNIRIDTNFTRKFYRVNTPPGFSKTLLHAELNRAFHPLSVATPAKISLPEEDMLIQLIYRGTVFRSISIQTDPDLVLERNPASIFAAFEEIPSNKLLEEIISLGEPISIVLRVPHVEKAVEFHQQIDNRYSYVSYWLEDSESEDPGSTESTFPSLSQLEELRSGTKVLTFNRINAATFTSSSPLVRTASKKDLSFIDVSNALILNSKLGESVFKQELVKFEQRARKKNHPIAIIMTDEQTLEWLREKLNELKKGGLYLVSPPEIHF